MLGPYAFGIFTVRNGIFLVSNARLCISGHSHRRLPVKLDLFASEEVVDLLQCEVSCFGVEEVDQGKEAEVEN